MKIRQGIGLGILLTFLGAAGSVANDLYMSSMPQMGVFFGATSGQVQMTLTVFMVGFTVMMPVYGPLSDRFGRKLVMGLGFILYTIGSLICLTAPVIEVMIGGRLLQAMGVCSGAVIAFAIVRDIFDKDQASKLLSYMTSSMSVVPILAPILGGQIQQYWGWHANFIFLTLFGVVLVSLVWLCLSETNPPAARKPAGLRRVYYNYRGVLASADVKWNVLLLFFYGLGIFSFIVGASYVVITVFHVSTQYFGFCFGGVFLGSILGGILSGRFATLVSKSTILWVSGGLSLIAGVMMAGFSFFAWGGLMGVIVPMALFFLACSLASPTVFLNIMADFPQLAGAASALANSAQLGAGAVASLMTIIFFDGTTHVMAYMAGFSALAIALITLKICRPEVK